MTTVGYVGLGNMGGALARRLELSRHLVVHDPDPSAVARAAETGCTPAASLAELGAACDVVMLCLPTSEHVQSVVFGEGGLASAMREGSIIIDQTSGDPTMTRSMAATLATQGIRLLDAPVSGGAVGAEAGTIAIMVGASAADYAEVLPVLTSISPNVFRVGEVGAGHVMKLANNLLSGAQRLMTFEVLALAEKNGVTPEIAHQVLLKGGARNAYLEDIVGPYVLEADLFVGFTLALQHKDVRLACKLGTDSGVPLLLGNLTRELYQLAMNELGPGSQVDTVGLMIDRMAGTQVVPPNPKTTP